MEKKDIELSDISLDDYLLENKKTSGKKQKQALQPIDQRKTPKNLKKDRPLQTKKERDASLSNSPSKNRKLTRSNSTGKNKNSSLTSKSKLKSGDIKGTKIKGSKIATNGTLKNDTGKTKSKKKEEAKGMPDLIDLDEGSNSKDDLDPDDAEKKLIIEREEPKEDIRKVEFTDESDTSNDPDEINSEIDDMEESSKSDDDDYDEVHQMSREINLENQRKQLSKNVLAGLDLTDSDDDEVYPLSIKYNAQKARANMIMRYILLGIIIFLCIPPDFYTFGGGRYLPFRLTYIADMIQEESYSFDENTKFNFRIDRCVTYVLENRGSNDKVTVFVSADRDTTLSSTVEGSVNSIHIKSNTNAPL